MNHLDDGLERDIGLWLAGESADDAADRAVTALATRPETRVAACAALAVEDLVRDWYGRLPVPPPAPHEFARRRRRRLVSAWLAAVAAGIAVVPLAGGDGRPFERALDATASWLVSGRRPAAAASSWGELRRRIPDRGPSLPGEFLPHAAEDAVGGRGVHAAPRDR